MQGVKLGCLVLGSLLGVLCVPHVYATNGMNMIAYDAISGGMAGADAAVESGLTALAANPANLTSVDTQELAVDLSLLMPVLHFENTTMMGANSVDGKKQIFPLPFLGYARHLRDTDWYLGVGLFAQGGMGVDFKDVQSGFGTEDSIYSNVAYGKIAPAVAYKISDRWSLGASFQLGYSTLSYDFFPATSFYDAGSGMMFPGQKLENATSFGYSGRIGLNWKFSDQGAFGFSYTSRSKLDYQDADLTMNFSAMGLGKVKYDAEVDGFEWPDMMDIGVSYYLLDNKLLLAADATWYNWKDSMKTITVSGNNPDNAYAPSNVEIPFVFDWDAQWEFSFGCAYKLTEIDTLRTGYNYGKNPVPDQNMYPLFPAIVEHHLAAGYGHEFGQLRLDIAWEHAFEKSATNTNADPMHNPFGPDSKVSHDQNTIHMMLTYTF